MARNWEEDYEAEATENKRLRDLLRWALQRLPEADKVTLQKMVEKEIIEDSRDDAEQMLKQVGRTIEKMHPFCEKAINGKKLTEEESAKLDNLLNALMEYSPKKQPATLRP